MMVKRRELIKSLAMAPVAQLFTSSTTFSQVSSEEDSHFFIQVMLDGGWDPFYLTDSRARSLTAAGKVQNYFARSEHALPWTDADGNEALVSFLFADKLKQYRNDLSLINGIIMNTSFDGHDQNANIFYTGSAFGGAYFAPFFNRVAPTPLDYLQVGSDFSNIMNSANSLPVSVSSIDKLVQLAEISQNTPVLSKAESIIFERLNKVAGENSQGLFSQAAQSTLVSYQASEVLAAKIKSVSLEKDEEDSTPPSEQGLGPVIRLVGEMFRKKVAKSALIVVSPTVENSFLDTHGVEAAKAQEALYEKVTDTIATVFSEMTSFAYDEKKGQSLLDVTTLLISSEFGRTMRQAQKPIDATGTDHNPLNNSAIVAGKGIQGGLILGSSDLKTPEAFDQASKAHLDLDAKLIKTMGMPYDFDTQETTSLPEVGFDPGQYITVGSVVNTLMKLKGVDPTHYRKTGNQVGAPVARTLDRLLKL